MLAILQQWSFSLPDQPKIKEAYQMLRTQGVQFTGEARTDVVEVPAGEGVSCSRSSPLCLSLSLSASIYLPRKC